MSTDGAVVETPPSFIYYQFHTSFIRHLKIEVHILFNKRMTSRTDSVVEKHLVFNLGHGRAFYGSGVSND